jgi:hypothetical protein
LLGIVYKSLKFFGMCLVIVGYHLGQVFEC